MLLLHIFLTPPIEVYAATNVEQNFVITNLWQLFVSSHTPPSLSLSLSLSRTSGSTFIQKLNPLSIIILVCLGNR